MGFKEILNKIKEKKEEKKSLFRNAQNQDTVMKILEERKKSANERELEGYLKEEYEKKVTSQLELMRKKRKDDLAFNHNPLFVKNITNHSSWDILKEDNIFKNNKSIFTGNKNIFTQNKNIFTNKLRKKYL